MLYGKGGRQAATYVGSFKAGQRHGQGAAAHDGLWEYTGAWRTDARWGRGRCTYADGGTYDGDWCNDERSGTGRFSCPSGYEYDGEWRSGKEHGTGAQARACGEITLRSLGGRGGCRMQHPWWGLGFRV